VSQRTDIFELEPLGLQTGQGRRLELHAGVEDLAYAGEPYTVTPALMPVVLDVSRTTHAGYALRLRFSASINGPCMRCLEPATPAFDIDSREISVPGGGDEMQSPYVNEAADLDLKGWVRDALVLAIPDQIVCRPDCAGLCPVCGENRNEHPDHAHERDPDPRWAKLRELKLD
jgi:uncharacterized protein